MDSYLHNHTEASLLHIVFSVLRGGIHLNRMYEERKAASLLLIWRRIQLLPSIGDVFAPGCQE